MKNRFQKGQVLLVTIMLLATVVTVVMTVVFRSTSNTQLTKLQEESNKALVAAESGLEKALKENAGAYTFTDLGLTNMPGIILTASKVEVAVETNKKTFVSPLVSKDQQYTFYMASYDTANRSLGTDYFDGRFAFYFASDGGDCSARSLPAIELTFIDKDNGVTKKMIEPCDNGNNYIIPTSDFISTQAGGPVEGINFSYRTSSFDVSDTKVIIARVLFAGTKIGLSSMTNLKPQGRNLTAETKATSGVTKKVQLFQSYPQLPSEFFVTNF